MAREKGLFDKQEIKKFAKVADKAKKFKNPLIEMVDDKFFALTFGAIDDLLIDKIPEDWRNPLDPIIDAAFEEDWQLALELAKDLTNQKLDIKGIDEEAEGAIIGGVFEIIRGVVLIVAKKELASQPDPPRTPPPDDDKD